MVEIRALESSPNVTLIKGATQHWSDAERGGPGGPVWERLVRAAVRGSCLVVGAMSDNALAAVASAADELAVVVRAIPDAARFGRAHPSAAVWCGDVADLPAHAASYDTVVCVDLSAVLPLESESRPWSRLFEDVRGRVSAGGTLVLAVENDLGPHRLTASHNPRMENSAADWAPLATWDVSRPRTVAQLTALGPGAVWALSPGWPDVRVAWHVGGSPDAALSLALKEATWPLKGPDPMWTLQSLAKADRLDDAASAWLALWGPDLPPGADRADLVLASETGLATLTNVQASGRPWLGAFADACASSDLPAIRQLLAAWAAGVTAHPDAAADHGFWLVADDGAAPLVAGTPDPWAALVGLVATIRGRRWRHPWPAPTSDADLIAILGAMAGLGIPPANAAQSVAKALPRTADPFGSLDRQQLVAAIDRNQEEIRTLRSRASWLQLQLDKALRHRPSGLVVRGVGFGKRVARGVLRRVRGRRAPG